MAIRILVGVISRLRLVVRSRVFGRGGLGLVLEQVRNNSLEVARPYRVSDMYWSVEVEGYADVSHLLVCEEGEVGSFEGDGFGIVWEDWKGFQ